jgi:hypothetical protein
MADIKVELNGDDVNRAIADAIVKSVLGDTITKMVNDYVRGLSNSYENPLKKVIEAEVKNQVTILVTERLPEIRETVAKQLADGVVDKITAAAIEKLLKSVY